ncbi:hypothetical protein Tco_0624956 [Tanacetum coccineum]|uniref:Uncharacterized protein n=1 Tax=Tanacetum coccineum TaxID=301880 RepID=A0ABQ4WFE7_9ASTR
MDDMIRNKNAKFAAVKQEIDTLKQTLSKHVKEKESLMTTFIFFKMESKEKENKYIDKEIDLKNKIKELDNIVHKLDPISEQLVVQPTPVKIEVPSELPKCSVHKKCFEIKKKELLLENDQLLELIISQDLVHTAVNSLGFIGECESIGKSWCEEYNRNITVEVVLSKMNELSKTCSRLQNHCISLELKLQQYKESFQNNSSCSNLNAPALNEFFIINDVKAQLQAKESSISKLRAHIATLKGKNVSDNNVPVNNACVIALGIFKLDLEPLSHRHKNNRETHEDYLQKTKEHTDTLRGLVEQAQNQNPSDPYLDYACKFAIRFQELLVYVSETCPGSQVERKKLVDVTPMDKTRKVRYQEPQESSGTT